MKSSGVVRERPIEMYIETNGILVVLLFKITTSIAFQTSHPSIKSMLLKANDQRKKKTICQIFHQKKSESFDEN